MRVVLIDDEDHCHQELSDLLIQHHSGVTILANGYSVAEGKSLINQHQPDLVFLDVEMGDGTGFDLLTQIDHTRFQLIFVTAHNEYAQMAIRTGAIDYLLKPVNREKLGEALERAEMKMQEQISRELKEKILQEQIQLLLETYNDFNNHSKLPTRLAIATSEGINYLEIKDIIRLEAHQNYTEFTISNNRKLISSTNIGEYVDHFEPYPDFKRTPSPAEPVP